MPSGLSRSRCWLTGRLALLASLLTLAACAPPRVALRPVLAGDSVPHVVVLSWNLDAGRGDLPRLVDDVASGRLSGAVPAAYILLLQEAREPAVSAVAAARGLHAYFAAVRAPGAGNAVLSTLRLDDPRTIELPRERQPRNAVAATVAIAGQRLFVVSAHLENRVSWWRGGLISDRARGRQAQALLSAIPADAPGIVGGDLNTWLGPAEPAWRRLAARFPDTPDAREPTFRDRLILDHLFFDLPDGWMATTHVITERYGSNHHPVLGLVH
jgi:endonuclease/exonuclease/phosphatase family metal-dependent hydrolase